MTNPIDEYERSAKVSPMNVILQAAKTSRLVHNLPLATRTLFRTIHRDCGMSVNTETKIRIPTPVYSTPYILPIDSPKIKKMILIGMKIAKIVAEAFLTIRFTFWYSFFAHKSEKIGKKLLTKI